MTKNELIILKDLTGRSQTAIYKVAHALGRTPRAWEVLTFSPPTKPGRKSKYVLHSPLQIYALDVRLHLVSLSLTGAAQDLLSQRNCVARILLEGRNGLYLDLADVGIPEIWNKELYSPDLLTEIEIQELDLTMDDVLLKIIQRINVLLYGGVL